MEPLERVIGVYLIREDQSSRELKKKANGDIMYVLTYSLCVETIVNC